MSHTPHELPDEFPSHVEVMQRLKNSDAHFARLYDDYYDVNNQVFRGETNIQPMDDEYMEGLRRKRMKLKDEIWAMLRSAS